MRDSIAEVLPTAAELDAAARDLCEKLEITETQPVSEMRGADEVLEQSRKRLLELLNAKA